MHFYLARHNTQIASQALKVPRGFTSGNATVTGTLTYTYAMNYMHAYVFAQATTSLAQHRAYSAITGHATVTGTLTSV